MKNIFVNKLSNLIKSSVLLSLFGAIFVAGNVTAGGHESAEESPHEWSANMAILSEYSFRGISQSTETVRWCDNQTKKRLPREPFFILHSFRSESLGD